jgi:hypothetical protein
MNRASLSVLVGWLWLVAAPTQQLSAQRLPMPAKGVWVSYGGHFSTFNAGPGGGVSNSDGWVTPFSIRLDGAPVGGRWGGRFRFPGTLPAQGGSAPARAWQSFGTGFDRDPNEAIHLWRTLLDHHAPPTPFLFARGSVAVLPSSAAERHQHCARRIVSAAYERAIAAEGSSSRAELLRRSKRQFEAQPPAQANAIQSLLTLLNAPLERATRASAREILRSEMSMRPDQAGAMQAHGHVFSRKLDMLSAGPAPAICTEFAPQEKLVRRRDQCSIFAIVDRRDGWPFSIGASRKVEQADGSVWQAAYRLERIQPVEALIPPNPCA